MFTPLGVNFFNEQTKKFMLRVTLENLGCVALSCQVTEGSETLNLSHVTMATPTLGVICHPLANTCLDE